MKRESLNGKEPLNGNDKAPAPNATQAASRKIDRRKVAKLAERGLTASEIAQAQGVHRTTIWRFLRQTEPERRALETFKSNRADVLARIQGKSLDKQERILDSLADAVLDALTPSQKGSLLIALNAQHGTLYDKERLERGQSTSNISLISSLLDKAVQSRHKRKPFPSQSAAEPQPNGDQA